MELGRRFRFWLENRRRASLLRQEIETHLSLKTAGLMEAGMTGSGARNEARRRLGNLAHKMEESRAVWIARWISDLGQDFAFAARAFRKQPGFTAAAVDSSALGIGACATIFGIANMALLRPLPVEEPSRLASISRSFVKTGQIGDEMSRPNLLEKPGPGGADGGGDTVRAKEQFGRATNDCGARLGAFQEQDQLARPPARFPAGLAAE